MGNTPAQVGELGQGAEVGRLEAGLHQAQVPQPGGQGQQAAQVWEPLLVQAQADLRRASASRPPAFEAAASEVTWSSLLCSCLLAQGTSGTML